MRNALVLFLALCIVGPSSQSVFGKEPPASENQLLSDIEAAFKDKDKNPANKRKSAWRGGNPASSKRTIKAPIETPTEE